MSNTVKVKTSSNKGNVVQVKGKSKSSIPLERPEGSPKIIPQVLAMWGHSFSGLAIRKSICITFIYFSQKREPIPADSLRQLGYYIKFGKYEFSAISPTYKVCKYTVMY